jgi:hypothetical protein
VPPPPEEVAVLEGELARLGTRQSELDRLIPEETSILQELGVRLQSMHGSPHLATEAARLEAQTAEQATKLTGLRRERSENDAVLEGLQRQIERRRAHGPDDARGHIRNAAEPVRASKLRFDRAAELWAAVSISLLLIGLAILILAAPGDVWAAIIVLLIAFIVGESVLRGNVRPYRQSRCSDSRPRRRGRGLRPVLEAGRGRAPGRPRRAPALPAAPRVPSLTAERSRLLELRTRQESPLRALGLQALSVVDELG